MLLFFFFLYVVLMIVTDKTAAFQSEVLFQCFFIFIFFVFVILCKSFVPFYTEGAAGTGTVCVTLI